MNSRTRFLITVALVCHLLLAPSLVTSQLLSGNSQQFPDAPSSVSGDEVTIRAISQERVGPVFKLHGQGEIHYRTYILYADEVTYDSSTGDATADGHVVLDGGPSDEHIEASHAAYNIRKETGHFENVTGTVGIKVRGPRTTLTSSNPFVFTGKVVDKTAPDRYLVIDGTVTTCELPRPKWVFNARRVYVDTGKNATIYNSTFKIRGVPILYLPFATHPVQREVRESGFLIPSIGQSSTKGTVLGESVFLVINRSMDAHIGAEYFSQRGWSQRGEFRAQPSEKSYVDLNYFGVLDRGIGNPVMKQGGENARLNAEDTFGHFRGVANIDYLSSYVFRLAFNEIFSQAVFSEVKSQAFLSNTTQGFSYNASVRRYQNFESTSPGDVITILHAPSFESSGVDRQIAGSPFYWSYDAAAEGLSRSEPSFRTANLVGRFDLNPGISLPLRFRGWSVRPDLAVRDTYYTQQLLPSSGVFGVAESDAVNRKALEAGLDLRPPPVEKVFAKEFLGHRWKHVIEPRIVYRYVTGVDNFQNILRFDDRDILSDTNEVEYSLVNRLYAKRTSKAPPKCGTEGMPSLFIGHPPPSKRIPWEPAPEAKEKNCSAGPAVREIVSWELAQKHFFDPSFGGALVRGRRNVFTTTADLTGIAFVTDPRVNSPLISRLRIATTDRSDAEWDLDYDFKTGQINSSLALMNFRVGPFTLGGGDAFLRAQGETTTRNNLPTTPVFNQIRMIFGYGSANKRGLAFATHVGYDAKLGFLQYGALQTSYNWDCCGISLEYRRFALGSVRNENLFRFNFALTNVGSFGNLRHQERLY
ncbi:MAG TPA: LPS assembly protein LptD [Terriglobales bacterium]|nr:LPS assembly protein LptD [Terriglobales bacterium]